MSGITEHTQENNLEQHAINDPTVDKKETDSISGSENGGEDPNWRAFREARKNDRKMKEAAEKKAAEKEQEVVALKAAMEAAFAKESSRSSSYYEAHDEDEETEDDRIEKKVQAAITQREAALERARQKKEHEEYPQRLVQTYNDFNHIVSTENLDYLEYHYPEIARSFKRLPDDFDKWADIYKTLKKFVPNIATSKKDSARAIENFSKPKSISSTGLSTAGETAPASRLSDDRKASNWERMQKSLRGLS